MKRESGSKPVPAVPTTSIDDAERQLVIMNARSRFLIEAVNMGWKLALMVLIPLILGVKLDERFSTSPSLTLAGFFIAAGGAAVVVVNTFKGLKAEQDANEKDDLEKGKKSHA